MYLIDNGECEVTQNPPRVHYVLMILCTLDNAYILWTFPSMIIHILYFQEAFHGCNVELHRAGSAIYSVIAQEKKVDPSVFATYFLPAILSHFENKNPSKTLHDVHASIYALSLISPSLDIGKFWLTTLLSIIHYLPKEVLKHKVQCLSLTHPIAYFLHQMMTVVRLRGQLSQPVPSRQTCCKILSRMGSNLETNW